MQVRTLVQQALNKALEQHDLLLSPVAPTTAFKIGEKTEDPLAMYKEDLMTVHLNLAGKLVYKLYPRCITITGQVGRFRDVGCGLCCTDKASVLTQAFPASVYHVERTATPKCLWACS